MTKFKKYSEIENTYRQKTVNLIVEQGKSGGTWCVVEKAHGSNSSFWTSDGVNFKPAKRTAFVEEDEKFNNIHDVLKDNLNFLRNASTEIKDVFNKVEEIIFFGEIIGGSYNHKAVPKNPTAIKVQKGVFYSPDNLFYLFDVKVNGSFIDHHLMSDLAQKYKIKIYAESIFEGDLEECLNYPNDGQSIISDNLDLEQISDNIMEGTIIKPVIPSYFNNGSRVILKNKNEKFAEKAQKSKRIKVKKNQEMSENFNYVLNEVIRYVTENRLKNVISKFGDVTEKDFGKLCGMFTQDALNDFKKDNEPLYFTIVKEEQKILNKRANTECANMLRKNFLNIIDKEF
jgi:Rnl2 family RNA ligase